MPGQVPQREVPSNAISALWELFKGDPSHVGYDHPFKNRWSQVTTAVDMLKGHLGLDMRDPLAIYGQGGAPPPSGLPKPLEEGPRLVKTHNPDLKNYDTWQSHGNFQVSFPRDPLYYSGPHAMWHTGNLNLNLPDPWTRVVKGK